MPYDIHDYLEDVEECEPRCLEASMECSGPIQYRMPLSGSGKAFPRCDHHWEIRLAKQEEINQKYAPDSSVPPEGFDPSYAGECWDE